MLAGWVISQLQSANFEVKNIHVLSVYYSATLYRWVSNKDKIAAKYGDKWYRLWAFFLARSTIISQQGSLLRLPNHPPQELERFPLCKGHREPCF
ncbi:hypothetical protein D9758_018854 [Tetrapyrgos nigripes]|uniref:sphingolipid C(9)-methyltransferase n=1 Tax=Tetrapyrgos nigripes TaxID=182062 RepID=A0A8H5B8I7_9AGAR|nr:hypothetical protein D9758_018854 [Tetrapyrgos nigripes]